MLKRVSVFAAGVPEFQLFEILHSYVSLVLSEPRNVPILRFRTPSGNKMRTSRKGFAYFRVSVIKQAPSIYFSFLISRNAFSAADPPTPTRRGSSF